MRQIFAPALLALSAVMVSACGFTPVYSTSQDVAEGSIQIDQIDGASGHILRRELLSLLRPGLPGVEQGRLVISLEEDLKDFAFRTEGGNVRTTAESTAEYLLYTDKGTIRGKIQADASFIAASTPYGDITSRRDATNRAAMELARKLVTDLQIQSGREDAYRASAQE